MIRRPKGLDHDSHMVLNVYECDCGNSWEDTWDCGCDDECGECGADVSPSSSEDDPDCDCADCRNKLVHHSSRAWSRDADGWWCRPFYRKDAITLAFCNDSHVFKMDGRLYCRNAKQKRVLDNGRPVR
jgi:hypothetical protein